MAVSEKSRLTKTKYNVLETLQSKRAAHGEEDSCRYAAPIPVVKSCLVSIAYVIKMKKPLELSVELDGWWQKVET